MADNSPEAFRLTASGVTEVDFVVIAGILEVKSVTIFLGVGVHELDGDRFVVVASLV